jgi:hypothetical protein
LIAGGQQDGECLLIKTNGVVVGVNRTGPIAGRAQVTRALRLARAEAEMMSQQYEVLNVLSVVTYLRPWPRMKTPMKLPP